MGPVTLHARSEEHRVSLADFAVLREAEDGLRYELLDGVVLVTPAPSIRHQVALARLYVAVQTEAAPEYRVLFAPVDVVLPGGHAVLQPDLVLARRADFTDAHLPAVPLLVVEVLSPTTWHRDLGSKLQAYAAAGVPHYWLVDPAAPAVTVLALTGSEYTEIAHVRGSRTLTVTDPVALTLSPADLVD